MIQFRYVLILLVLLFAGATFYFFKQSNKLLYPAILLNAPPQITPGSGEKPETLPSPVPIQIPVKGGNLAGFYSTSPLPQSCAVILVHAEFSDHRHIQPYGNALYRQGCDIVTADMRGYSASRSLPSTWGNQEPEDIISMIEYVKSRRNLTNNQVGIIAMSMGAVYSAKAVEKYPDLAFVLLDSFPIHVEKIIQENKQSILGKMGSNFLSIAVKIASSRCDCQIGSQNPVQFAKIQVPVQWAQSKQDNISPNIEIQKLFDSLPGKKKNFLSPSWPANRLELRAHNPGVYDISLIRFLMTYSPDYLLKK